MSLDFTHGIPVNKLDTKLSRTDILRDTGPYAETVLLSLLQADSEKAVIFHNGMLLVMTRPAKPDIMRIASEGAVFPNLQTSGNTPSLKPVVRELEGTVLYQLGVQSAICCKVYIFNEDTVHRRCDFRSRSPYIKLHLIDLSCSTESCSQDKKRKQKPFHGYTRALLSM